MMIRGIRGATTVAENSVTAIEEATIALLEELFRENKLEADAITSIFFSATADVNACFPAKVVRTFKGFEYVPVISMVEMDVPKALPLCIRVMLHCDTTIAQSDVHHAYQKGAQHLRPDLSQKEV
ncbi:chorismate mutase [Brochothrix thermosphacta]|uniref:chorismate mutase n=2 Tax=Listeriaceae TaxID=186820 RepID=A0A291BZZ2_BROTH|nr:chorismate mutase [Brochothrix thermosphacta]MBR5525846.1 chorismate mutase [Brochothrix sp.]ATF26666.1 chorismate mutase [Brochothrix thermosphacta]ATH86021.1 chorismate mutase [Brochothrix thermosphacta]MPQ29201.1 chorismate mutase [Brochothrix thermosphacta]SPP26729.1 chorismate mutase [Brochothrix thermosphacta]